MVCGQAKPEQIHISVNITVDLVRHAKRLKDL